MKRWDIDDENIFWSFGIFALTLIILLVLIALFFLAQFCRKRFDWFHYIEDYLKKKLFFGSIIRYMIEAYLKVFHNSLFFLYITASATGSDRQVALSIVLIIVFALWPLFVFIFLQLHCNRPRLDEDKFRDRYGSMYLDNKTDLYLGKELKADRSEAFVYSAYFCLRRLCLVLCFFCFHNSNMMNILFGTLAITTVYVVYIIHIFPHTENYFNYLEVFNECAFMMFTYSFFGYSQSEIGPLLDPELQYKLGNISLYTVGIVYWLNFIVMLFATFFKIRWAIRKIKRFIAKRKAKRALKAQESSVKKREQPIDASDASVSEPKPSCR